MKVLYKKEYMERIIYAIEINEKLTFVYKSSGLSGTGHGGNILPFMYLNSENRFSGPILGYIWKEFRYENNYFSHRKKMDKFEGVQEKLDTIKKFLIAQDEFTADVESPEIENTEEFRAYINEINAKLKIFEEQFEWFDYKNDNIKI